MKMTYIEQQQKTVQCYIGLTTYVKWPHVMVKL